METAMTERFPVIQVLAVTKYLDDRYGPVTISSDIQGLAFHTKNPVPSDDPNVAHSRRWGWFWFGNKMIVLHRPTEGLLPYDSEGDECGETTSKTEDPDS
jgi:hypothetical protein